MIRTYGSISTGYNLNSIADILKLRNYAVVSSTLMGTEYGPELWVHIKVGEQDNKPILARYTIHIGAGGDYSYSFDKGTYQGKEYNAHIAEPMEAHPDDFVYETLGQNHFKVKEVPTLAIFDEKKAKESAFWCLKNHYKKELSDVFSIATPIEDMENSEDIDIFHCEEKNFSEKEQSMIYDAGVNFFNFRKGFEKRESQEESMHCKLENTYFGYTYDENGFHNGAVELHSVEEVAKFVYDEDNLGKDKVVTDILDQKVLNTFGAFVDKFGNQVPSEERQELLKAIVEKQQEILSFNDTEPEL